MRVTLSLPDEIGRRFLDAVPPRHRSRLVAKLLEEELAKKEDLLAAVCIAANNDSALEQEIDEWQSFDDRSEE